MKLKRVMAVTLAATMGASMVLAGCGSDKTAETAKATEAATDAPTNAETAAATDAATEEATNAETTATAAGDDSLPTITFTHGYYHEESEWPAAAEMRAIYQEFADAHKSEYNFVINADVSGSEGIYNTALNDISAGSFYDIADFAGWNITDVASAADMILDLKPYLDEDAAFKAGVGVCYDQNATEGGQIYSVREQIEGVGFWYNSKLFQDAGADAPDKWQTWDDFNTAVDKLTAASITPFGLNAGWPTNILLAANMQKSEDTRNFYAEGKTAESFDKDAFKGSLEFIQKNALQKIDAANFGPGGDDDEAYRTAFFEGKTAMLFNGVWDAGGSVDCAAGAENIKPAVFPTDEAGKKAALLSGGGGFVISNKLDEVQTKACVDFVKYMTSPEVASRIIEKGIGMAPSTEIDYEALKTKVTAPEAKLLVEACQLCQSADYQALGLGNNFGDAEGEIQAKYAGLKDDSKTVDSVVQELNDFLAAAE